MKNFKSFVAEEKPNIKRKAKGEQDFVDAHEVEITDPTDQGNNSAKVTTKANSGKHKNDRADNKQEFGEAVKKTYQVSGKALAAKMRQNPSLKAFADKVEKMPIVTPQMVDKMLPDYISGGEITKLFKESVEDLDENPIVGAIARAAISSAVKKAVSSGSSNKEESVKPDVEKAFPASGVRKHNAPKGSSTMPKDKEKAKGQPAGSLKEEETQTYMVKFEKNGKVSLKNYEAKSDLDARSKAKVDAKRMGMTVASVRLKEEVELDEMTRQEIQKEIEKIIKLVERELQAQTNYWNRLGWPDIAKNPSPELVNVISLLKKGKVKDVLKFATTVDRDTRSFIFRVMEPIRKISEEVELDELKTSTLWSYRKKASDDFEKRIKEPLDPQKDNDP